MTATTTALVPVQPAFSDAERLALAGFLAGYRGLTRKAYALDLRQFTTWCRGRSLPLFAVRRADIEGFARDLEARGRARATVTRRLCTIAGFYKYAVEEELLEHSPAAHVRRPRADYESHAVALDRNELGALLVAAGLGTPGEHALISARAERAAGIGGHRRGHRAPGPRTRAPDADDHPEGRQGRDHSAGAADRPGDRPGRRRAHRGAGVPGRGWAAAGPARRRADRPQDRPTRRDRQDRHAAESARGAVPALPPARFPGPLAEPAVRVSAQRALHGCCHQAGFAGGHGAGILFPR
jgi:integrase family protein with SAM-like domain